MTEWTPDWYETRRHLDSASLVHTSVYDARSRFLSFKKKANATWCSTGVHQWGDVTAGSRVGVRERRGGSQFTLLHFPRITFFSFHGILTSVITQRHWQRGNERRQVSYGHLLLMLSAGMKINKWNNTNDTKLQQPANILVHAQTGSYLIWLVEGKKSYVVAAFCLDMSYFCCSKSNIFLITRAAFEGRKCSLITTQRS